MLILLHSLIQFNFHHQSHRRDIICIPLKDEKAQIKKSINLLNVTQMEKGRGRIQTQAAHVLTSELKLSTIPLPESSCEHPALTALCILREGLFSFLMGFSFLHSLMQQILATSRSGCDMALNMLHITEWL